MFEPFLPGRIWDPKVTIPDIDATNPSSLLDLFIQPTIYATIAENTVVGFRGPLQNHMI